MPKTIPHGKLLSIGPERMDEVDNLLNKGVAAREVAETLQTEWGVLTDMKADTLKKSLERYRGTALREKVIAQAAGATKGMSIATLKKKANAMEELEELMLIQKGRFHKILTTENKQDAFLMKDASEAARLLKETLVELGKLQLETGVMHRAPKKITGSMTNPDGTIASFEWSEEQAKLAREIEDVTYTRIEN